MAKLKDRVGYRYEKLTVVSYAYHKRDRACWNCLCECGNEKVVCGDDLGDTKSCGCLKWKEFDINYFEVPTVENSYWAGFIAADGSVAHGNQNHLTVELHCRDRETLEGLAATLRFKGEIKDRVQKDGTPKSTVSLSSAKTMSDLRRVYNITPRKSLTLIPPNLVDESHIKASIVGYIDGDGSIGMWKTGYKDQRGPALKVLGTKEMLEWVHHHFDLWVPPPRGGQKVRHKKGYEGNQYEYSLMGQRVQKLGEA